jgi:hypothetical protein
MQQNDEDVVVPLEHVLQHLVVNGLLRLPNKGKAALAGMLERFLFPWYELLYDRPITSNRKLRTMLAEYIEKDLSRVLWTHVMDDETGDSDEFMVIRVISQSTGGTGYDLLVMLGDSQGVPTGHVFKLADFLSQFRPSKPLSLENYNA